jgi:hypothetical protein
MLLSLVIKIKNLKIDPSWNTCHLPFENGFFVKMWMYHILIVNTPKKTHLWYENDQII